MIAPVNILCHLGQALLIYLPALQKLRGPFPLIHGHVCPRIYLPVLVCLIVLVLRSVIQDAPKPALLEDVLIAGNHLLKQLRVSLLLMNRLENKMTRMATFPVPRWKGWVHQGLLLEVIYFCAIIYNY